jgi:N-acetylated-alpha-linked acidic dipeptidase
MTQPLRFSRRPARQYARLLLPCALAGLVVTVATAAGEGTSGAGLFGFSAVGSAQQRALEQRFDAALDPADLGGWLKTLSAEANHVGSPHDKANAERVRDLFNQWGWNAQIEVFDVLYPTLKSHTLELVGPSPFVASLREEPIAGDATSTRTDGLAPYNEYGADGDVTGELVYLNYGMPQDYEDLARRGIDVKGKIVITRYGGGWRGLKPKLAQEHGAVGCIIYSDPQDDGYSAGDVYPKGGFRPASGLQRGSVLDMALYPGDPLTPGVGATKDARRLAIKDAKTILKIPVLPISYGDAQPFLAALAGPVAPARWRGGLPITYHMGPGPAKVHLAISSDWGLKPLYDVIARIPGSEDPEEWVVRGNHRDGWVFGAWDPLSGHVAMLAEAKAIGVLLKSGWRPKRTLIYASWDGEEPGLLGSTEWAEAHAAELKRKAVLYLNSDTNTRGFLHPEGSHSLQRLVNDVASGIKDPQTGVSVQARLRARMQVQGLDKDAAADRDEAEAKARNARLAAAGGDLPIGALGSGSDYSAFLQHLGLASLDVEYAGEEDQAGVYHSNYDSFEHYVRFGDPGFAYGVADAQTIGHIVLRMADAPVLPLQFTSVADTLGDYVAQLRKLTEDKRTQGAEVARLIDANAFGLAADPTRVVGPPPREAPVPEVRFAPLDAAVARLKASAQAYDTAFARLASGQTRLSVAQRRQLNEALRSLEQKLTNERGLPGREWFKHFVYAPGLLTGYGVKTLPAVREAIEGGRWDQANEYAAFTAQVLDGYCARLDEATALLRGG